MRCFLCGKERDSLKWRFLDVVTKTADGKLIWIDRDICEECGTRIKNTAVNEGNHCSDEQIIIERGNEK